MITKVVVPTDQLKTFAAHQPNVDPVVLAFSSAAFLKNLESGIAGLVTGNLTGAIKDLTNAANFVTSITAKAILNGMVGQMNGVLTQLGLGADLRKLLIFGAVTLINHDPLTAIPAILNAITEIYLGGNSFAKSAVRILERVIKAARKPGVTSSNWGVKVTLPVVTETALNGSLTRDAIVSRRAAMTSNWAAAVTAKPPAPSGDPRDASRTSYVQLGDTIIKIAGRELGDAKRWRNIAVSNGLDAPYIADDPTPYTSQGLNVAGPGTAILIPSEASLTAPSDASLGVVQTQVTAGAAGAIAAGTAGAGAAGRVTAGVASTGGTSSVMAGAVRTQSEAEAQVYGQDIAWNELDSTLKLQGANLALDAGVENLRLALLRRLITKPGGLPAHPEYGCMAYRHVGQPGTDWRVLLAAQDVRAALLQDPRVQSVTAEAELLETGGLYVSAYIIPVPPAETFTISAVIKG